MNKPIEPAVSLTQEPASRERTRRPPGRSRGRRNWLWLVALALLAVAGYYGYMRWVSPTPASPAQFGPGPPRPIPVVAVPARNADVNVYLTGLGTVTPLRTVTVRSRVQGELQRVLFQEGQLVKEGQVLAEIDPRPFQVQLTQAQGQMARDQALLANARIDLDRYRTLLAQDSIAKQQVDSQASLVRQYEGQVKADQGQIDNARLQLTYSRITAPISGRVGLRQVDPGNIVTGTEPNGLVVITQLQPITVVFTVPQDNLPSVMRRVQSGDKLPVEAWDREQKARLAAGVLASVDNLIDPQTGTVKLKAQFDNESGALFPNQFVNVRMQLDTLAGAIVVPTAAVQRGAQGTFVYVVKPDQTVTLSPVKLGPVDGANVAVSEGVAPGDLVVVDGVDRLREGAQVEVGSRPDFSKAVEAAPRERRRSGGEGGSGRPGAGGRPGGSPPP